MTVLTSLGGVNTGGSLTKLSNFSNFIDSSSVCDKCICFLVGFTFIRKFGDSFSVFTVPLQNWILNKRIVNYMKYIFEIICKF